MIDFEKWTCPEHGTEYGDGPTWKWEDSCPVCQREARRQEREWREDHRLFRWWDRGAGIPARYRCATVEAIKPETPSARILRAAVGSYVKQIAQHADAGQGLALFGPPGTGKTLALVVVVNAACSLRSGPLYASWPEALATVKAAIRGPQDAPGRHLLQDLAECPLLALDELGLRAQSDFEAGALFELIDHRYSEQLPTLIASNVPRDQLPEAIGERVADRVQEVCTAITTSGVSQRGRLACTGPDAMALPPAELLTREHSRGRWIERTHRIDKEQ